MSNWKLLGEFIEPYDERNGNNITNVLGLNKNKEFMPTVANMEGVELSKYKVITEGSFVFSGMQTGRDICIRLGMYLNSEPAVVSPAYTTFRVKKDSGVMPEYLFMYFYRQEMDRFGWFLSDSSIRANLDWERFTSIAILVPDIKVQRSMVAAWQGLREVQAQNERLAATLMPLCRSYLQDLKHKYEAVEIGPYLELCDETNANSEDLQVVGINKNKEFMPTVASLSEVDTKRYKIIKKGRFVFSGMQTGRDICIRLGLYTNDQPALMSPAYTTFEVKKDSQLLPEFLFLFFKRDEMDRLGWFYSDSSIRSNLDWGRFLEICLPLPPLAVQRAIVNVFNVAQKAKSIAAKAAVMSRDICPTLIQKACHS